MVFKKKLGSGLEQDIPVTAHFPSNSFSPSVPVLISSGHESSGVGILCHFLKVEKHN